MFDGINLLSVLGAAAASYLFTLAWPIALETRGKLPRYLALFLCHLLMAFVFAGVILHVGGPSLKAGLISAALIWIGFVLTTSLAAVARGRLSWKAALSDNAQWLSALLIQGCVIGLTG